MKITFILMLLLLLIITIHCAPTYQRNYRKRIKQQKQAMCKRGCKSGLSDCCAQRCGSDEGYRFCKIENRKCIHRCLGNRVLLSKTERRG